jgi:hypothetical protein
MCFQNRHVSLRSVKLLVNNKPSMVLCGVQVLLKSCNSKVKEHHGTKLGESVCWTENATTSL